MYEEKLKGLMMRIFLAVNRFETNKGVWTVIRVEGDSYEFRDAIKGFGEFRYGYAFDDFVQAKAETGLDGREYTEWLRTKGDRSKKKWALHWNGEPAENRARLEELARTLGEACQHGDLEIRETDPVVYRTNPNGVGLGDEDVAPAGPGEDDIPF